MITAIGHLAMIKRGLAVLFQIEQYYFVYLVLSSIISPVIPYINIFLWQILSITFQQKKIWVKSHFLLSPPCA
jgi:hypothetical protein